MPNGHGVADLALLVFFLLPPKKKETVKRYGFGEFMKGDRELTGNSLYSCKFLYFSYLSILFIEPTVHKNFFFLNSQYTRTKQKFVT